MNFHGVEDYGVTISIGADQSFKGRRNMTPVFDQLGINACLSFSVGDAVSAKIAQRVPQHVEFEAIPLSRQELVDCVPFGATGSNFGLVYEYIRRWGLHLDVHYPYRAQVGLPCNCLRLLECLKVGIVDYEGLVGHAAVMDALQEQPVTAGIILYDSFINRGRAMDVYANLEGEIPRKDMFGRPLLHAVLVIGHGTYNDEDYYIIKNSMGVGWGVNGYTRVAPRMLSYFACPGDFVLM